MMCSIGKIYTKGGAACGRPPFVGMSRNVAHDILHDASHAVQSHILKNSYPDLGKPMPYIQKEHVFEIIDSLGGAGGRGTKYSKRDYYFVLIL